MVNMNICWQQGPWACSETLSAEISVKRYHESGGIVHWSGKKLLIAVRRSASAWCRQNLVSESDNKNAERKHGACEPRWYSSRRGSLAAWDLRGKGHGCGVQSSILIGRLSPNPHQIIEMPNTPMFVPPQVLLFIFALLDWCESVQIDWQLPYS